MRRDRIVDYQKLVRAQRFSPSPIRRSNRSNSKANKFSSLSQAMTKEATTVFPSQQASELDKENNTHAGASECRTFDATPEAAHVSQHNLQSTSPKLEVDNMGLFKLPILKNQTMNKPSDASRNYPSIEIPSKLCLIDENGVS